MNNNKLYRLLRAEYITIIEQVQKTESLCVYSVINKFKEIG